MCRSFLYNSTKQLNNKIIQKTNTDTLNVTYNRKIYTKTNKIAHFRSEINVTDSHSADVIRKADKLDKRVIEK